jgi:hypothetical protein
MRSRLPVRIANARRNTCAKFARFFLKSRSKKNGTPLAEGRARPVVTRFVFYARATTMNTTP